jgi:hypothetical protein
MAVSPPVVAADIILRVMKNSDSFLQNEKCGRNRFPDQGGHRQPESIGHQFKKSQQSLARPTNDRN